MSLNLKSGEFLHLLIFFTCDLHMWPCGPTGSHVALWTYRGVDNTCCGHVGMCTRGELDVMTCVRCGCVGLWICGRVDVRACGRVDMLECRTVDV